METKSSTVKIYNGAIINRIFQIDITKYHPKNNPSDDNPSENNPQKLKKISNTIVIKCEDTTLYIKFPRQTEKIVFHTSVWKLLDFLAIEFTKINNYRCEKSKLKKEVCVSIEEYISLRSDTITDSNKKKIRKEIEEDLRLLSYMSISGEESQKKRTKTLSKTAICEKEPYIKTGNIYFCFSESFADYLVNSYPAQYPLCLLKLEGRNPNSYSVGRKLAIHHSIRNNRVKGTNNKIGVKTLLGYCVSIPGYDEVMASDRQVKRRIYDAFEKTLDSLNFDCVLKDAEGNIVTRDEIHRMKFSQYQKLYVHFSVPGEIE